MNEEPYKKIIILPLHNHPIQISEMKKNLIQNIDVKFKNTLYFMWSSNTLWAFLYNGSRISVNIIPTIHCKDQRIEIESKTDG